MAWTCARRPFSATKSPRDACPLRRSWRGITTSDADRRAAPRDMDDRRLSRGARARARHPGDATADLAHARRVVRTAGTDHPDPADAAHAPTAAGPWGSPDA